MTKKIILFAFVSMFFGTAAFSQIKETNVNPNAEHDRMYYLIKQSEKLPAPEYIITALKTFAKEKGLNEKAVLRNTILLSPIYNTTLSKADRLFACNIAMRACSNNNPSIPCSLITTMMNDISKN